MKTYMKLAEELTKNTKIVSRDPGDPVEVLTHPEPWKVVGCGNYAAVFLHPEFPDLVVKIYGRNPEGLREEILVYETLGEHPAYSQCYGYGERHLILKRIKGVTLYDCLHKGIKIPQTVIRDVDNALSYARGLGLFPRDVHGKNVMLLDGRGIIVDVSDFCKREKCSKWNDLRKAYYRVYLPVFYNYPVKLPYPVLNAVRIGYRWYKKWKRSN
ncbi:serine/threonine protein kinase [Fictibacillus sp. S7]|uniref:serine/threonine protein kinase n=1 Tax=Fictibacillus sp. S7 TaxID=2212476 RepID=UPI001011B80B|nr:serine/threonine protein kinase [Fictibacillus sp. S7]RXY99561.1 serine/threonine protein kinase [Fictibacillus sp. S7]